ncbi:NTP-binding protein [Listeria monocytogenes]|nr:NTP-binding protein [Listeria monocytogenes]EAG8712029.1 NTP-binding protein [Listeria monocytogenes]EAG8730875.1 NTP-binding protein [Listeria monocytogenes]
MQFSYSRVSLFKDCPYHFKLRYLDKLTEIPKFDANNPLIIGNAMHKGIETDSKIMLEEYYNSFPVITDEQVNEAIKLEILLEKVKAYFDDGEEVEYIHEYMIDVPELKGFVDLIVKNADGNCYVIDFKYSNHVKNYVDSGQLHIYQHFLEQAGFNVVGLGYLFIPKTSIRQKNSEDLHQFRNRLVETVTALEPTFLEIKFDQKKVDEFFKDCIKINNATEYPKNVSGNCFGCNPNFAPTFLETLQNEKGEIEMTLPKNERREKKIDTRPDLWLYADSYVGKSTFVDQFDNLLFANTDGNTDNTSSPVVAIRDEVWKEGRQTKRKFAWQVFLDLIKDLETEENTFEAIAIDLYEDLRDHCRNFVMDKYGWEHESDGSYGKGWQMVTKEFQNAIKRLKALDYQIIYISKEVKREVTLRGGNVKTTYIPNVDDKTANFTTGTVDLTIRAYMDDKDNRMLQLAKHPEVFGGGRFNFLVDKIKLDMNEFIATLVDAQEKAVENGAKTKTETKQQREPRAKKEEPVAEESIVDDNDEELANIAKRTSYYTDGTEFVKVNKDEVIPDGFEKTTKKAYEASLEEVETAEVEEVEEVEEAPKTRERRQRKPREEKTEEAPADEETRPRRTRRTRKSDK